MIRLIWILMLSLAAQPALARKPCEELKSEIEAKIRANGVKVFTLRVVTNEEARQAQDAKDGKVVGSCDGGTRKIVYKRG